MRLIENARAVLRRSLAVRVAWLAATLQGASWVWPTGIEGLPAWNAFVPIGLFAASVLLSTVGVPLARVVAQRGLSLPLQDSADEQMGVGA
ncbi:hypothetical protein [Salinarimonas soli]|uniref:Uncharacterized protein n=1 Tax=Salinarimonas soli TaxID=1638099 RepID=A0A5B2VDQ3_9HYPH|nr:hypothetical protein [Salinarimonas soli]KAA2237653.1 hypothetical protein F0L46_08205 [Salinarimonas soli]